MTKNAGRMETRQRQPLVAIMGAPFETGNLGVSALASGTIASVMELVGDGATVIDLRLLTLPNRSNWTWRNSTAIYQSLLICMPALKQSVLSLCEQPEIRALLEQDKRHE